MSRNTMLMAVLVACLLGSRVQAQQPGSFDLAADFSLQSNPNGVWQYGYSAGTSLDPKDFRLDRYSNHGVPVGFWHPEATDQPGPGYYPYVAYNSAGKTSFGSSNGWAVRADEIAMEASNSGQYSLVRFVVPQAGTYSISAKFTGIHFGLSTTDVHVLHNADSLFDADIEGYGGDPAFHVITGAHPTANYDGQVKLEKGEIITFALGYGKNKTNYGDTTGLIAHVTLLAGAGDRTKHQNGQPSK
jgi:hypothetical protein